MSARDLEQRMWAEACDLLNRAERLQRHFFRPVHGGGPPLWEPPVDLYESGETLWIVAAMPGARTDSVDVRIEGRELVLRAERGLPDAARTGRVHRVEIPYGRFERRLTLPPGSYRLVERDWREGCLYLGLQFA